METAQIIRWAHRDCAEHGRPTHSDQTIWRASADHAAKSRTAPIERLFVTKSRGKVVSPFPSRSLSARGRPPQGHPAGAAVRPGCARSLTRPPARAG
jgi:hypothetical protein